METRILGSMIMSTGLRSGYPGLFQASLHQTGSPLSSAKLLRQRELQLVSQKRLQVRSLSFRLGVKASSWEFKFKVGSSSFRLEV